MPRKLNTAQDIWRKIDVCGPDDCWPYQGAPSTNGYGQFYFDGRLHTAHVVVFELVKGPVPPEHVVDHDCHNRDQHCRGGVCPHRLCCNPDHLDAVTNAINARRSPYHKANRTHCPQNHAYSGDNLVINKANGGRVCRTCNNANSRARKHRRRAAFVAQGLTTRGTTPNRPQAARDGGSGCPGTTGK